MLNPLKFCSTFLFSARTRTSHMFSSPVRLLSEEHAESVAPSLLAALPQMRQVSWRARLREWRSRLSSFLFKEIVICWYWTERMSSRPKLLDLDTFGEVRVLFAFWFIGMGWWISVIAKCVRGFYIVAAWERRRCWNCLRVVLLLRIYQWTILVF